MSGGVRFRGIRFEADLVSAILDDGAEVRFTRRERALLTLLVQRPGKVLSREVVLNALAHQNLEMSDRNIDFLVNRLRRKLDDSPRSPRFIATRYGEGYEWVAPLRADAGEPVTRVFLRLGPVLGMRRAGLDTRAVARELNRLRDALERRFDPPRTITVRVSRTDESAHEPSDYALQFSCLKLQQLKAVAALRDGRNEHIYRTWQLKLSPDMRLIQTDERKFVDAVHRRIVEASIFTPTDAAQAGAEPLSIALDRAAELFPTPTRRHRKISRMLRARLEANPGDHEAGILLAVNLHVAIVRGNLDELDTSLARIESLVLTHLEGIQQDPLYLSAAAKLLYFVGHRQLAIQLAEKALDSGMSHAATLMVMGQISLFEDDLDFAVDCFDQAIGFCDKGTRFHTMLLMLKASAKRVAGDMDAVRELAREILRLDGTYRLMINAYLLGDEPHQDRLTAALAKAIPVSRWQKHLRHLYYVNARLFVHEKHRVRMLEGLTQLAMRHAGPACLIDELRESVPGLFASHAKLTPSV